MRRRTLLKGAGAAAALPLLGPMAQPAIAGAVRRVRPSDPGWPSAAEWQALNTAVGGQLSKVEWPLAPCLAAPDGQACKAVFHDLRNPYYLRDQAGLTCTTGWVDGWTSAPSVYAVAARHARDVAAAVSFARTHKLRLVVKGGGHSYTGTSDAPDSLLVWMRPMTDVVLHDAFVPAGCTGRAAPLPAVTLGAGAIWMPVYEAVMGRAGRYVQGGGCATVGVAGLVQSGGFGSFSKQYGTAAGSLLEAEVVTADGAVRTVNACQDPDLFWALKGGGGGSFGAVTRLTLRTHDMPDLVGPAIVTIRATSDAAFRRLVGRFLGFARDSLCTPHWGEQVHVRPDNVLAVTMLFQRLDRAQAQAVWQPLLDWIAASPHDFALTAPPLIQTLRARDFWDGTFLRTHLPHFFMADDRPGAPPGNVWSAGDAPEASQFMHGLGSAWLPASLLADDQQSHLADALFAASRHWPVGLHFNKGLAGAPAEAVAAARDTATNPAVLDAFALAICGASRPLTFPAVPGHEPDLALARRQGASVGKAMAALRRVAPDGGAYVSESDYFQQDWQQAYWGPHYARLAAIKQTYDPDGLFCVRHGVGSEGWSDDGFTRRAP